MSYMMRNYIMCRVLLAKFIAMIKSGMRWTVHVVHTEKNRDALTLVL